VNVSSTRAKVLIEFRFVDDCEVLLLLLLLPLLVVGALVVIDDEDLVLVLDDELEVDGELDVDVLDMVPVVEEVAGVLVDALLLLVWEDEPVVLVPDEV
jgi:hypothetical protein